MLIITWISAVMILPNWSKAGFILKDIYCIIRLPLVKKDMTQLEASVIMCIMFKGYVNVLNYVRSFPVLAPIVNIKHVQYIVLDQNKYKRDGNK